MLTGFLNAGEEKNWEVYDVNFRLVIPDPIRRGHTIEAFNVTFEYDDAQDSPLYEYKLNDNGFYEFGEEEIASDPYLKKLYVRMLDYLEPIYIY